MTRKLYEFYEPNTLHKKKSTGDCVIRAITKATGKTWLEVFDELVIIARELMTIPSMDECYIKYLEDNGFVKYKISNSKGTKRPTVTSFTKENKEGTYILKVANHIVCVKDGVYYDAWDCGECCLYAYWKLS